MNKRIKMKKGLMMKRCDNKCWMHREYVQRQMYMNNVCISCRHKPTMDQMIEERFKNIKDNSFCEFVKEHKQVGIPIFKNGKCEGYIVSILKSVACFCSKCKWLDTN